VFHVLLEEEVKEPGLSEHQPDLVGSVLGKEIGMADVVKNTTITIASAIAPDVIDAYAHEYRYTAEIDGDPNPESKAVFALRMFTEQAQANIRSTYKSYMTGVGAREAQVQADVDSLNITVT
jgi:hypothetical protein